MGRISEQDEWDYVQLIITSPAESPEACSPAGGTPDHLDENSPRGPEASPPSSPQQILSPAEQGTAGLESVGGLLPEVWAGVFQQNQFLLEPIQPWLCERLERKYRGRWWLGGWLGEAAESCILRSLCIRALGAGPWPRGCRPSLRGARRRWSLAALTLVQPRCSEEAQGLLHFCPAGEEDNSQAESSSSSRSKSSSFSSSSSQESTPTSGSSEEEEAGTSEVTHHGIPSQRTPVPSPAEWDQPQKEPEPAVAGPSAPGSSCNPSAPSQSRGCLPRVTWCAQKRKAPRPLDSCQPSKRP